MLPELSSFRSELAIVIFRHTLTSFLSPEKKSGKVVRIFTYDLYVWVTCHKKWKKKKDKYYNWTPANKLEFTKLKAYSQTLFDLGSIFMLNRKMSKYEMLKFI